MTLVDERPATEPGPGDWLPVPVAARRAQWRLAARIAWREVVRRRARTALVIALIAVPTAAMILAAIGYRTSRSLDGRWDDRGTADIVIDSGANLIYDSERAASDPLPAPLTGAQLGAVDLPAGTVVSQHLWAVAYFETPADDPGSVSAILTDVDPTDAERFRLVEIDEGRAPSTGEVFLSSSTAAQLGVDVGDMLTLDRPAGTWAVSGIGRFTTDYSRGLVWMPGFDIARIVPGLRNVSTLIDLPDGTPPDQVDRIVRELPGARTVGVRQTFEYDTRESTEITLGWLAGAMAFLAFGIVITAAFATSARQQLASVGQLSANGAPTRLIGRVLSWQGLWSGLLGGLVGAALAIGLLPVLHAPAEQRWYHRSVDLVIRPIDIVVVVLTATVAGLLAALVPARSLARTTVLSALAGRRPAKRVPPWLLPLGLVLLVGGTGVMTLALLASRETTDTTPYIAAALLAGGALAVGTCCVSPWAVQQLARCAHRLPLAGRLALRGLSRSRGRSAAVISAIAVTVALGTAAVGSVERSTNQRLASDRHLPRDTVVLDLFTFRGAESMTEPPPTEIVLQPLANASLPDAARDVLTEALPNAQWVPLRRAVAPAGSVELTTDDWKLGFSVPIANDATLRAGGWTDAARDQLERVGHVQMVSDRRSAVFEMGPRPDLFADPAAPAWSRFATLMTEEHARENDFDIVTTGVIVVNSDPLNAEQRKRVSDLWEVLNRDEQQPVRTFIEPGDPEPTEPVANPFGDGWQVDYVALDDSAEREAWMARGIALAAALVLVGVIVAIGLALAAADERGERSVFAAVGARPASIRRMAAWNAVTMTLIGIAIGVPIGFVPTWVVVGAAERYGGSIPFPWMFVVAVVAIVPAAMAGIAWLTARLARPPSARRLAE